MLYITQGRYTREAVKGMVAHPEDRKEAVAALAKAGGGRLVDYYVTLGEYDFLAIFEGPADAEKMLDTLVVAGATGGVSNLHTTVAFTTAQFRAACQRAGEISKSFKAAGGTK